MASTTYFSTAKNGFGKSFSTAFNGFLNTMSAAMEAHPRMRRVQALQAMSDEKLAERGLKREDIVRHVFRDFI